MLDIIFQYGWELVLIHRILIGFEAMRENKFYKYVCNKALLSFEYFWKLFLTSSYECEPEGILKVSKAYKE